MKLGTTIRIMGPQSTASTLGRCVEVAEAAGLEEIWVADHIAIPPDDAEGSGGRYLDPLTALAWMAARTERIGLGTGVLNLPYRPPLPSAKAIATVQELSAGRLRLGVGIGWMEAEFRALGIDRRKRGRLADHTLDLLQRWFSADLTRANEQPFLFLPRPHKPEILVGGMGSAARRRAVRYGDAWLPMARNPAKLAAGIIELREMAAAAGRPAPQVVVLSPLPLEDRAAAEDRLAAFAELGVERVAHAAQYEDSDDFLRQVEALARLDGS